MNNYIIMILLGTVIDIFFDPEFLPKEPIVINPNQDQINSNRLQIPIVLVQFDEDNYSGPSFFPSKFI